MKQQLIPKITQEFMKDIESKSKENNRIEIDYAEAKILIDVFPYVFPPSSDYSVSTKSVYSKFGDLSRKRVLDIGTGTGIQAIVASLAGAYHVDAVDIQLEAVACAKHNVRQNKLENNVNVFYSDMFSNIPYKTENKYDLIIANLPILDIEYNDEKFNSLFDANFRCHKTLFQEADKYLKSNGIITLSHANLQSKNTEHHDKDFQMLEELALKHNYEPHVKEIVHDLGYEWRCYEFMKK